MNILRNKHRLFDNSEAMWTISRKPNVYLVFKMARPIDQQIMKTKINHKFFLLQSKTHTQAANELICIISS